MAMTARMRRLASDYEQIKKDFAGHKNIIVTPVGDDLPESYHVTYFVNGIYLLPDGRIETLGRHEVDITLHADYPRYKPICRITTPIWHPNFRDGQICIGDIWGAGESLTDIIVNIGDMIQYKSWNSFSPLSADAAQWAMENKHLFPVGNIDLYIADYASAKETVEIDLEDDADSTPAGSAAGGDGATVMLSDPADVPVMEKEDENDFEITAEELAGIEFVPTAQRMQTLNQGAVVKGGKVNFKTVLVKGLIWALIGAILGFIASELLDPVIGTAGTAKIMGYSYLAKYYEYSDKADDAFEKGYNEYKAYCRKNGKDYEDSLEFLDWYANKASTKAKGYFEDYYKYDDRGDEAFEDSYKYEFHSDMDAMTKGAAGVSRVHTGLWSAVIALFIGLLLGIGEGVYYGSAEKALKYGAIGAGISILIGFVSGYLAQWMYATFLGDDPSTFMAALIRGLGWAIMGIGIGLAVGLIKPTLKRVLFCGLGGLVGAFVGGFVFNFVTEIIPNDVVARGVGIIIMGLLIGVGVGLLEQFAKQAWLKVIRGEFEGKEYLVFNGTTSIGNNGKNTIVLFKDKLVGAHHCDIILEGAKYVIVDCGTPMGTVVNGMRITRQVLRQGDAIAVGNSVLIFNTK